MRVIITSPSLDASSNVSGISAVTQFIVSHNRACQYRHFALGKKDAEARVLRWLVRLLLAYPCWLGLMLTDRRAMIHFNLAVDRRSLTRDSLLILMARLLGRRVVIHLHGGEFIAGGGAPYWLEYLFRMTCGRGPVIVLSRVEQAILRERLPRAKLFVLPNCVPLEDASSFQRTFPSGQPPTMLFLGRIAETKGIDAIYGALQILRLRGAKFRFIMAGSGPAQQPYVRRFQELLGADFEFRGVVAGAAKAELLKKCDVFLLPSLFEGMPMALLESMAFGVVPITTAVGSIRGIITPGRNGILVNAHAPAEIAAAIGALSSDKNYIEMLSRNASLYIQQNLQPDNYVRQLNTIYQYE